MKRQGSSSLRFSIRDVLWLTVVVAAMVGWWVERNRAVQLQRENFAFQQGNEMMRQGIEFLEAEQDAVVRNLPRIEPIYTDEPTSIRELQSAAPARTRE